MKKPTIEIKVNNWTKRTSEEQADALIWVIRLMSDLSDYAKGGIADNFTGKSD